MGDTNSNKSPTFGGLSAPFFLEIIMAKHSKMKPDPYKPLNPYYGSAVFKPGKPSSGSGGGPGSGTSLTIGFP